MLRLNQVFFIHSFPFLLYMRGGHPEERDGSTEGATSECAIVPAVTGVQVITYIFYVVTQRIFLVLNESSCLLMCPMESFPFF
jgi:hypothetical protein